MQVFGMSDVGLKRSLNEDNFSADIIDGVAVALVCDGMGGANAGEVASRIACKTFLGSILPKIKEIRESTTDRAELIIKIERAISLSCREANTEVYNTAQSDESLSGMGTTLSGCIIIDDMLWTYNVGDSRVYLITKSSARQLTVDHSYVQALLDDGKITKEEAENHPNRNVILRALGVARDVECDVVNMPLEEGYYLICSDGMSNYFDEKKFVKLISSKKTIADKVEDLVVFANSKGGSDNITVVLIDTENGGSNEQ